MLAPTSVGMNPYGFLLYIASGSNDRMRISYQARAWVHLLHRTAVHMQRAIHYKRDSEKQIAKREHEPHAHTIPMALWDSIENARNS